MPRCTLSIVRVAAPLLLFGGCAPTATEPLKPGPWRMELALGDDVLPVGFELLHNDSGGSLIHVNNGDERIVVDDIERRGDSLVVRMPLFDSEFRGLVHNGSSFDGDWYNYLKGPDYRIPFTAHAGDGPRFQGPRETNSDALAGTWEVHFSPGTADTYAAVGLFRQLSDGRAVGTFLTETGDYRYLEGRMTTDSLMLSGFDGSHAFLFRASLDGDRLVGLFRSGTHWQEPWVAVRNPSFKLRDPDSLTYLREGYDMVDFRFPDLEGRLVSPSDTRYRGATLLVQVMGSWCPNCVDETRLLNELYERHQESGLEVLSVAFEKHADPVKAKHALRRYRDALGVRYPILYAGTSGKQEAAEKLPFLNHVMSFPTLIMIDHRGTVRRIRTGIAGPGTGEHYLTYKRSLETFVERLLQEARSAKLAQQ